MRLPPDSDHLAKKETRASGKGNMIVDNQSAWSHSLYSSLHRQLTTAQVRISFPEHNPSRRRHHISLPTSISHSSTASTASTGILQDQSRIEPSKSLSGRKPDNGVPNHPRLPPLPPEHPCHGALISPPLRTAAMLHPHASQLLAPLSATTSKLDLDNLTAQQHPPGPCGPWRPFYCFLLEAA